MSNVVRKKRGTSGRPCAIPRKKPNSAPTHCHVAGRGEGGVDIKAESRQARMREAGRGIFPLVILRLGRPTWLLGREETDVPKSVHTTMPPPSQSYRTMAKVSRDMLNPAPAQYSASQRGLRLSSWLPTSSRALRHVHTHRGASRSDQVESSCRLLTHWLPETAEGWNNVSTYLYINLYIYGYLYLFMIT